MCPAVETVRLDQHWWVKARGPDSKKHNSVFSRHRGQAGGEQEGRERAACAEGDSLPL